MADGSPIKSVSTHSIRYRILKVPRDMVARLLSHGVSTHSIRYRILKEILKGALANINNVSTHSIRYRILKVRPPPYLVHQLEGFNPFDPIQDTESWRAGSIHH